MSEKTFRNLDFGNLIIVTFSAIKVVRTIGQREKMALFHLQALLEGPGSLFFLRSQCGNI